MNDGRNKTRECVLKDNLVPYTFENFQIFLNQKMGTIFYLTTSIYSIVSKTMNVHIEVEDFL